MGAIFARPGPCLGLGLVVALAGCAAEGPEAAPVLLVAVAPVERMVMPPALPGRITALSLPDLSQPAPLPVVVPVVAPAPEPEPAAPAAPAPVAAAPVMVAAEPVAPVVAVAVAPVIVAAVATAPPAPDPAPIAEAPAPATEPPPAPPVVVASAPPPEPIPRPPAAPREPREGPRVQLVAAGSEAEAMRHWARLTQQLPELTEGRTPLVLTLERPDQPTVFRLRLGGFASAEAAQAWCAQLRARGSACWVSG
jgi:hypothetical protein